MEEEKTLEEQGWKQLYGCIYMRPDGAIININTWIEYATEDEAVDALFEEEEELTKKYEK